MLTTAQTAIVAVELVAFALACCLAIAVQLIRSSDWSPGRHAAPPTPPAPPPTRPQSPAPPAQDGGERRRLADWREQLDDVPALDHFRIAPYVARPIGAGR